MNYDSLFDSDMSPDLTADMGYQNESGADTEPMGSVAASSIFQGRMDRVGGMNGLAGSMTGSGGEYRSGDDSVKPHILMFGLKRSGKSSILRVVFDKMDPRNTRQLESTKGLEKSSNKYSYHITHTQIQYLFILFIIFRCFNIVICQI